MLSKEYITLIAAFAPVFSRRVWRHVQVLLVGAILAPSKLTVTALLRVMGLSDERHFQTYHRVLNRAVWSSLEASRILLGILVSTFAATGTILLDLDELKHVLQDCKTEWTEVTFQDWYGQGPTVVELALDTAVWYHSSKPPVPIR
jgi:hypothetical protein